MSITNIVTEQSYLGTGAQVLFSIPFQYQSVTEIYVYKDSVLKVVNIDYTLTDSGGVASLTPTHIKFGVAPALNAVVLIKRITPNTQTMALLSNSSITLVNAALDKLTQLTQELSTGLAAAVSTSTLVSLQEEIDAAEAAILVLQGQITTINNTLLAQDSRIDDVEADVIVNTFDIASNAADILTNTSGIANNALAISGIQGSLVTITATLANYLTRIQNLEQFIGVTGYQSLANNTAGIVLTDMLFSYPNEVAVIIDFSIIRKTDTNFKESSGLLYAVYSAFSASWRIEKGLEVMDYAGVVFSISPTGQISCTTSDLSGTNYTAKIRYNIRKFEV